MAKYFFIFLSFLLSCLSVQGDELNKPDSTSVSGSFVADDGAFLLNGEPFIIKAAELHYPRIPQPYHENRIKMCKALGMNTICLYVFWNLHEPCEGEFDFDGENDLRRFIELCRDNDMKVILRPGPYVCAEWEMGGLPWWLLKKKDIRLRERDPYFMQRVDRFMEALAAEVGDLTVAAGGPIIMVQVENEYGSYGTDKPYISEMRDILRKHFGEDVTMFQCDWSSNFINNGLDDLIWTINFGTGADIDRQFAPLKAARPDSPLMCSEFWSGWFDKWGASHETRPADNMVNGIDEMLSKSISFSLYMTHGGTNFGHWAGANSPGYAPDVTSYDYDAPISESGRPTPKYWKLREVLAKYADGDLIDLPDTVPIIEISEFSLTEIAPIFENLPEPKFDNQIRTMEEYDHGFGSIIYRTNLPALSAGSLLTVEEPHDYAQIFINGKHIGTLDRRKAQKELILPAVPANSQLDIFVEAMGRINFGRAIKDFKGITDHVTITENHEAGDSVTKLSDWMVYNLHDEPDFYTSLNFRPAASTLPRINGRMPRGIYRGTFSVETPGDTFLDFSSWGKGLVYVNGHALGRFWYIGPQQTLYTPGCWLREGENEIVVFDVVGPESPVCRGRSEPLLDMLRNDTIPAIHHPNSDLSEFMTVHESEFSAESGWQSVRFDSIARGRYVCIEAIDAHDGGQEAAIAELYLLDTDGKRLPREQWIVSYVDSEETIGNHTAEKAFDLQESTYWQTAPGTPFPHTLVIDLQSDHTISGLDYLPRMEPDSTGSI